MARFWTSDWHFGHYNVITYCNRPFFTVEEMNEAFEKQWNSQVKPDDEVMFVGDFSLNEKWVELILPRLNGIKHLFTGNHDACFPGRKKALKAHQRYLKLGWASIRMIDTVELKNGLKVLVSHLPYAPRENANPMKYDIRYLEQRPKDQGMILVHGHAHGRYIKDGRMIDVGIDAHNLKLVTEDELIAIIEDKRVFIPSSLTAWYEENDQKNRRK